MRQGQEGQKDQASQKQGGFGSAAAVLALMLATGSAGAAPLGQPAPWQMGLQDGVTSLKSAVGDFHSLLLIVIVSIVVFVSALLLYVMVRFSARRNPVASRTSHHTLVEVVWTVVPILILIVIAVPSFKILYMQERIPDGGVTVKAIGHQWYWSYEYPDHGGFSFDAVMVEDKDLKPGQPRLLETDNRVVVPVGTPVRVQMTSEDVIHAWTVPAFGVKKDAVPGRLNEIWFTAEREGVYYGQCSEICGTRHGFMPIAVEVVSRDAFTRWVNEKRKAAGLVPMNDALTLAATDR